MKLQEAIARTDKLKPNSFSDEDKVRWLSELDGQIYNELVLTHCHPPDEQPQPFTGYTNADMDHELLVPFPYTNVYDYWLQSQIDLNNGELGKYNNTQAMFNAAFQTFSDYYTRTHMPKQRVMEFRM